MCFNIVTAASSLWSYDSLRSFSTTTKYSCKGALWENLVGIYHHCECSERWQWTGSKKIQCNPLTALHKHLIQFCTLVCDWMDDRFSSNLSYAEFKNRFLEICVQIMSLKIVLYALIISRTWSHCHVHMQIEVHWINSLHFS